MKLRPTLSRVIPEKRGFCSSLVTSPRNRRRVRPRLFFRDAGPQSRDVLWKRFAAPLPVFSAGSGIPRDDSWHACSVVSVLVDSDDTLGLRLIGAFLDGVERVSGTSVTSRCITYCSGRAARTGVGQSKSSICCRVQFQLATHAHASEAAFRRRKGDQECQRDLSTHPFHTSYDVLSPAGRVFVRISQMRDRQHVWD